MQKRSLIIGAGITGLTLAYELKKKNRPFILVSEGEPGGVMGSEQKLGFTLERGPQVLLQKPALIELAKELGIEHLLQHPQPENFSQCVWHQGKAVAVPRKPQEILKSKLFTYSDLFRLACTGLGITKQPTTKLNQIETDISVADFFTPFIGKKVTFEVIAPVLRGIYGGDIEQLSARSLFPNLWKHVQKTGRMSGFKSGAKRPTMSVFKGGSAVLTEALVKALGEVTRLNSSVLSIAPSSNGFSVNLTNQPEPAFADEVFICTAGGATSAYISDLSESLSRKLSSIKYAGILVSHFSLPRSAPVPSKTFGVLFPPSKNETIMGAMFTSEIYPCVAPTDRHLVTCFSQAGEKLEATGQSRRVEELKGILGSRFGLQEADHLGNYLWNEAIPQYELGHQQMVDEMKALEQKHPGLYFVGNDHGGIGVPDRISAAVKAAETTSPTLK
jgi:protoporphyrinogen/coproporphyrinogen III oxidase